MCGTQVDSVPYAYDCGIPVGLLKISVALQFTKTQGISVLLSIIIIIIINAKIKVTLNTNVAGALYKNYQTK